MSLVSQACFSSHTSLKITLPSRVTGDTRPRGSYTFARLLSTPLLVGRTCSIGNFTLSSSLPLSQPRPNMLAYASSGCWSCCLANVRSVSLLLLPSFSPSSAGTFECHLCKVKLASSKISIACSLRYFACCTVALPEGRASHPRTGFFGALVPTLASLVPTFQGSTL